MKLNWNFRIMMPIGKISIKFDNNKFKSLQRYDTASSSSSSSSSYGSTAQYGPWPPLLGFRNNNLFNGLDC
jgi:hypothetical protein